MHEGPWNRCGASQAEGRTTGVAVDDLADVDGGAAVVCVNRPAGDPVGSFRRGGRRRLAATKVVATGVGRFPENDPDDK
jgi:hypothetical protein